MPTLDNFGLTEDFRLLGKFTKSVSLINFVFPTIPTLFKLNRPQLENPISTDLALYILWVGRNHYWLFIIITILNFLGFACRVLLQSCKIWNIPNYYDVNYFRRSVFFSHRWLSVARFNLQKCKNGMLNWLGGVVTCHEIIGQSLAPVSLGRASPMKLGGEILVPCFWSVPEQRINFLATMSSTEMNTKLLRKPVWRKSLQRCLIRYWVCPLHLILSEI